MMRVGYLTYGLDREPTGIGRYAADLLRALAAQPDAPEIVLLTTEREDPNGLWRQFERCPLPGCRLLPALLAAGNVALAAAARRYRLDLVHDPNGIAPWIGLPRPVRRIVTLHDAFPYLQPETHNRLDNWRYRWHLPPLARRADAVITVSACSKADLVRHLALRDERVHVIGEGIDPRFKPVPDGVHRRAILAKYGLAQPYILYLGGVNGRKNIARLLEAFARARAARPGLTLVIGGPRQWKLAGIEQTLARLDLGAALRLTGYLADEDLPAIYSAAELFVFPSLYEGFGLPPLEAMACATPVVTSNCSSLPEVVGDAALLVDPYSVDSLVAAIEQALDDVSLRATLRRRGLARAAQFSWARAARETLALYKRVVVQSCTVGQGEPENEGGVPHEH